MRLFFFFSSRRRHTRFDCDWSSDVCSSDLVAPAMRAALRDVDRAVPAQALQTMDQSMQIGRAHVCSSHSQISYAVFCLKKKKKIKTPCSLSELDNISKRLDDIQQCETESEA